MKLAAAAVAALAGAAAAFPGMGALMAELERRQTPGGADVPMIGDLAVVGAVTPVGKQVKKCLQGAISCEDSTPKTYKPAKLGSLGCRLDTCCVWDYVAQDLANMFRGADGQCNDLARAAVRLGFHDAAAWNTNSFGGGADGSFLLNSVEQAQPVNNGLQAIRAELLKVRDKYKFQGVGAADLVQMAHNVATVTCPLGPRLLSWVGRPDGSKVNEYNLLPDVHAPADELIKLFGDKTIGVKDLIALIGAHSVARQRFVDASRANQPFDSTPGVWDVKFYGEAVQQQQAPPDGVFRLPSDAAFAAGNKTATGFRVFSDPKTGQDTWNAFYATAYARLSLLGVPNINLLTDCTKVLPARVASAPGSPAPAPAAAAAPTSTLALTPSASPPPRSGVTALQQLACDVLGICAVVGASP